MRLLLLLSAILTALTGAIGPRASVAQPVEASVPAAAALESRTAAVGAVVARAVATTRRARVALSAIVPAVAVGRAVPLYADRLRE